MTGSVLSWMSEYINAERQLLGDEQTEIRLRALNEMFHSAPNSGRFAEAMTTAHFPYYFSDALSREFLRDYEYQGGSWKLYTKADTAPDFRSVDRYRMTEPGTLYPRAEKAEAHATYVAESQIQYAVKEFARQFDVSWQAILNDDLGKIRETPARMARAAARFEDMYVSSLYDNATTQAALIALGAPYSGTGRLTAANLAIGINAMMTRTDVLGNPIQIRRIHLVIPPILLIQARTILESLQMAGVATNDKNVLSDYIAGIHVDPYIATAAPNVPWYLFADPNEIGAVTVVRLQGAPAPWVAKKKSDIEMVMGTSPAPYQMGSFATGDIEYLVEDVIGGWNDATYVGVTDYQGIYYSSGTTP